MGKNIIGAIKGVVERSGRPSRRRLSVMLDKESLERFCRLKRKLNPLKENHVIALALRSLEYKTDRVIHMRARKKARALKAEGLGAHHIAECLNRDGIPAPGNLERWEEEMVPALLPKDRMSKASAMR